MSGVRRRLMTWATFSLGLLLACSACGYLVRAVAPRSPKYTRYPSSYVAPPPPVALVSRPAPAFGPTMTPTPKDAAEFAPLFDALAAAARAGDSPGCAALWDPDRAAEEEWALVAKWTGRAPTDQQVRGSARDNRHADVASGRDRAALFRFDKTELIKVARSRDKREAHVLARHAAVYDGTPTTYGMRWWLVRGVDGWRVYDSDDPSTRMRRTVCHAGFEWEGQVGEFGPAAAAPPPPGEPPLTAARAVVRALLLSDRGSAFELDSTLAACRGAELPPPLAAGRAVAEARLRLWQGEPREAMPFLDEATRLDPTYPLTLLARGMAANDVGDHKAALGHLIAYRNAVGPDHEAALNVGLAQERLKRLTDALATYRGAVRDHPGRSELYTALARALPAGRKREAGELAAKGPKPADHLDAVLSAPEADDVALADEVVTGFLAAKPGDPRGLTAAAVVRVRQGQGPEAAALLRNARETTPDDEREAVRLAYLDEVLRHGVPLAGYNAVPPVDRSAAFRWLAGNLFVGTRGPLLELIAAHRAAAPADPWGEYWLAQLFAAGGRPERAEELLAAAMTRLPKPTLTVRKTLPGRPLVHDFTDDEADWDQFRASRTLHLFQLGRWRDAYRDLPPAVYTFDQLAFALDEADDVAGLAELVEMHKKAVPDDPEAIFWQGQVYWQRKETEKAVGLFAKYRMAAGASAFQKWRADEGRVRGLVRLSRVDEARQVLEGSDVVADVLPLQAVVAAATGDSERLAEVFALWVRQGVGPRVLYADPDLGPLLRGDRFTTLRAKYPPP